MANPFGSLTHSIDASGPNLLGIRKIRQTIDEIHIQWPFGAGIAGLYEKPKSQDKKVPDRAVGSWAGF
jgi:hypothetical protein